MDPYGELFTVGTQMMISQRDHDVIFSDHIHLHRIKRESIRCRVELDKFESRDDTPLNRNLAFVRVRDLSELIVFIPVEAHIIIG